MKNLTLIFAYFIFPIFLPIGGHNLTISEVESILGEPCSQLEKVSTAENGGHQFKTSFAAKSNNKVVLYYIFESYENEAAANKKYDEFHSGNSNSSGFKNLTTLGDEAFFQTDSQNFGLVVARKGNEMIRIKVNKTTSKFSKENLINVAFELLKRV